jgi:hypothetical protein
VHFFRHWRTEVRDDFLDAGFDDLEGSLKRASGLERAGSFADTGHSIPPERTPKSNVTAAGGWRHRAVVCSERMCRSEHRMRAELRVIDSNPLLTLTDLSLCPLMDGRRYRSVVLS